MMLYSDKTNHFSSILSTAITSFLYLQPLIFSFTTTDGRIAPRSGLASKNFIDTGAGVIDADYRGQVKVLLFNHSHFDFEGEFYYARFFQKTQRKPSFPAVVYCGRRKMPNSTLFLAVKQGDRIAQLVLEKVNLSAFSLLPLALYIQRLFDLGFPFTWIDAAVILDLYAGSDSCGGTSRERQGRGWVWKYRIGLIECRIWLRLRNL